MTDMLFSARRSILLRGSAAFIYAGTIFGLLGTGCTFIARKHASVSQGAVTPPIRVRSIPAADIATIRAKADEAKLAAVEQQARLSRAEPAE